MLSPRNSTTSACSANIVRKIGVGSCCLIHDPNNNFVIGLSVGGVSANDDETSVESPSRTTAHREILNTLLLDWCRRSESVLAAFGSLMTLRGVLRDAGISL